MGEYGEEYEGVGSYTDNNRRRWSHFPGVAGCPGRGLSGGLCVILLSILKANKS